MQDNKTECEKIMEKIMFEVARAVALKAGRRLQSVLKNKREETDKIVVAIKNNALILPARLFSRYDSVNAIISALATEYNDNDFLRVCTCIKDAHNIYITR